MNTFDKALAVATGTLALTRMVRLVVDDDYPPVLAGKRWLAAKLPEDWIDVVDCPWCTAPYLAAPAVGWAALMVLWDNRVNRTAWWIANGIAAASFAASYISLRDIPPESR